MGQKLKFVLSDLHLGAGYARSGDNPLEDFTVSQEFAAFLREIAQESHQDNREVELIINGDLFEFLQVPAVTDYDPTISYPTEAYLDSSEAASIKRLNIIVEGHHEIFDALSDFMHVEKPQRHVTIIKGNHDVNLFWPGVKSRLREILGASGSRASLMRFADEFVSREKIYIEHGHQRAEKMNGYSDSFDPRSADDPTQLYYPVGSHFVINFLNEIERRWPFVDQIKPLTTLIWYALNWNFEFAAKALAYFIRYSLTLSNTQLDPTRELLFPTAVLLERLEDDDRRRDMAQQYKADPVFRQKFHQQIQYYLDQANLDQAESINFSSLRATEDPLEMGRMNQTQQRSMLRQAAEKITNQEKAKVIVFGHTHEPVQELLSNGSIYINTGSWVKDFSYASPHTWEMLFRGMHQSNRPDRLPYARIDYDEYDRPQAKLLYVNARIITPPLPVTSFVEPKFEIQNFFEKKFQRLFRLLRTQLGIW